VAPEHRRRGIGTALLERALAFARERRGRTLSAPFLRAADRDPGSGFLERRGFAEAEAERRLTSHLDLGAFDAGRFAGLVARVERQGVRLLACADLPDTPAHRRRLYDLFVAADMEATDVMERGAAFDAWGLAPDRWRWAQAALVVADLGGEWVGFTQVAPYRREAGVWRTAHAATLPAHRNRGIGTALKLRAIALLRGRGCRVMLTENRLNNPPILAINRKLGYVPGPLEVTYRTPLRPEG
jgi:mycothiol synthase